MYETVKVANALKEMAKNLTGKLRIAKEGINLTVAGTLENVEKFINNITDKFEFLKEFRLDSNVDSNELKLKRLNFFKNSPGCEHVFDNLSVKVCDEITPFNVSGKFEGEFLKVSPEEFHELIETGLSEGNTVLLDTRNYYESKLGYFKGAITPPIRKFSSLPSYLKSNKEVFRNKKVLNYCTGGVRCAKACSYIKEILPDSEIIMLDGGIHNYIEWINKENEGKTEEDKKELFFLGSNYVFDARVKISPNNHKIVAKCNFCMKNSENYIKCTGIGCHLMFISCKESCYNKNKFCCEVCRDRDAQLKVVLNALNSNIENTEESPDSQNLELKKIKKIQCNCEVERRKKLEEGI
ncbi:thiosulfate sulfurtransferase (rhodanese)-like domain-containing protein 2 [Clydaea vesicula]|uniref:Thiosulfate sulfurtransferase (Rhodanese)-like domain-containing protein 2 n=1 Tax=Clydaea vesicula TaxID=447962 RepID=A0AAD5XYB8_9FUNG|nr:thiosulfate sulfurtransferase (rhodanese)-like domain-containing protein 2 [Clydaea vesicula]